MDCNTHSYSPFRAIRCTILCTRQHPQRCPSKSLKACTQDSPANTFRCFAFGRQSTDSQYARITACRDEYSPKVEPDSVQTNNFIVINFMCKKVTSLYVVDHTHYCTILNSCHHRLCCHDGYSRLIFEEMIFLGSKDAISRYFVVLL